MHNLDPVLRNVADALGGLPRSRPYGEGASSPIDPPDEPDRIDRPKFTRTRTVKVTIEMDVDEEIDARDECDADDDETLPEATEESIEGLIAEGIAAQLGSGSLDYPQWGGDIGRRGMGHATITLHKPSKISVEGA